MATEKNKKNVVAFDGKEIEVGADGKITLYYQGSNDLVLPKYAAMGKGTISDSRSIDQAVILNGGANVAFGGGHKTQRNVKYGITKVTTEEFELIKAIPQFVRRVANGFICIGDAPDKLVVDKSAQMTEKQVKEKTPGVDVKTGAAVKG